MSLRVTCPQCGASLTAPAKAVGKTSKCPNCQTPIKLASAVDHPREDLPAKTDFAIPAEPIAIPEVTYPPPAKIPPQRQQPIILRPGSEFPEDRDVYVACPFCSEDVRETAKKCKHCGETLDVAMRAAEESERRAYDRQRSRGRDQSVVIYNENTAIASATSSGTSLRSCLGCLFLCVLGAVLLVVIALNKAAR